jgi:putative oxidoreductase
LLLLIRNFEKDFKMVTRVFAGILHLFSLAMDFLTPIFDLLARIWVAYMFFLSGLSKIQTWESTVLLFTYQYHVPLLPPYLAALLGTAAELILPILLVLGLGGRITIFIFFIYNLIAMFSYPFLWTADGRIGLYQHVYWGLLLGLLMCHGPGKLSLDYLIQKIYGYWPEKKS